MPAKSSKSGQRAAASGAAKKKTKAAPTSARNGGAGAKKGKSAPPVGKKTVNKDTSSKSTAKPAAAPKSKSIQKPKAPAREAAPAQPVKMVKPAAKPKVDPELLKTMRELLVNQRQRLRDIFQSSQASLASRSGMAADPNDQASEGFEDELAIGLMAIEAAQLEDIEAAIKRIDNESYGICEDCGKAIPRKRLEVVPFVRRCLACEGLSERRGRAFAGEAEEEPDEAD